VKIDKIEIIEKILSEIESGAKTTSQLYENIPVRRPSIKEVIDEIKDVMIIQEKTGWKGETKYRLPNKHDKINRAKEKHLNEQLKDAAITGVVSVKRFSSYLDLCQQYGEYSNLKNLEKNILDEKLIIMYLQCVIESKLVASFLDNQMDKPLVTDFATTSKTVNSLIVGNLDRFIKSRPNKDNLKNSIADYYKHYDAAQIERDYKHYFAVPKKLNN